MINLIFLFIPFILVPFIFTYANRYIIAFFYIIPNDFAI